MRNISKTISIGSAILAGATLLAFSSVAQAHDWDRDHDRDHGRWDHGHRYYAHERPVVVHERPVFVERERPVFVAPPAYYAPPAPSGLNLNFNIPLN